MWWDTDRLLQEKIEESRATFVDKLLQEGNEGKSFYAAIKKLSAASQSAPWSVEDLFTGSEPADMCREVLDFYGNVSGAPAAPIPDLRSLHRRANHRTSASGK